MKSVLVAEDRDGDRAALMQILTASDYCVCQARNVDEAARALGTVVFDLAVINAGLPGGDAMDVFRMARRHHVPAVMITADPEKIVAFEGDGTPYIARPFAVGTFIEVAEKCAEIQERLRE